jgi:DNA-directed RNA polymerase beta subunit
VGYKFGSSWGGWCPGEPPEAYGVGLLKNIRSWGNFSSHTKFEVRDGSKVSF